MNSPRKKIFYKNYAFVIYNEVYEPAEDTFLIAESLPLVNCDTVLDMGTGCGLLAVVAADRASHVIAVDVNPYAVNCAQENIKFNRVTEKVDILQGDLFEPLKSGCRFDLILFNVPYLPVVGSEEKSWIEKAWSGGETGRTVIDAFLREVPEYLSENGSLRLVQSTLTDINETIANLRRNGMDAEVIAENESMFEKILLITASFSDNS